MYTKVEYCYMDRFLVRESLLQNSWEVRRSHIEVIKILGTSEEIGVRADMIKMYETVDQKK